jgi:hypothetical protein
MTSHGYAGAFLALANLVIAFPAHAADSDPAPCLTALAQVRGAANAGSFLKGDLPHTVAYLKPHGPLTIWQRHDGSLLILEGKAILGLSFPEGPANGFTFGASAEGAAERALLPSTYRKVALADGRTFEIHRLGPEHKQKIMVRSEAEDNAALEFQEDRQLRDELRALDRFNENLAKLERACEAAGKKWSELSFVEQFLAFKNKVAASSQPGFERPEADAEIRGEERAIYQTVDSIREARKAGAVNKVWREQLKSVFPERKKEANRLSPVALEFSEATAKELLKEAAADFVARTKLEDLDQKERESLAVCGDYLSLPEAKVAEPLIKIPTGLPKPNSPAPALGK